MESRHRRWRWPILVFVETIKGMHNLKRFQKYHSLVEISITMTMPYGAMVMEILPSKSSKLQHATKPTHFCMRVVDSTRPKMERQIYCIHEG
jgi:hypothetical protein